MFSFGFEVTVHHCMSVSTWLVYDKILLWKLGFLIQCLNCFLSVLIITRQRWSHCKIWPQVCCRKAVWRFFLLLFHTLFSQSAGLVLPFPSWSHSTFSCVAGEGPSLGVRKHSSILMMRGGLLNCSPGKVLKHWPVFLFFIVITAIIIANVSLFYWSALQCLSNRSASLFTTRYEGWEKLLLALVFDFFLELLSKFPYSVGLIVHLKTQPVLPAFLFLSLMVYLLGWLSSSAILL